MNSYPSRECDMRVCLFMLDARLRSCPYAFPKVIKVVPMYRTKPLLELGTASGYLGGKLIPYLSAAGQIPGGIHNLTLDELIDTYYARTRLAIETDYPELVEYTGSRVPHEKTKTEDNDLVRKLQTDMPHYHRFLRHFVERITEPEEQLVWAVIFQEHTSLLRYMLTYSIFNWGDLGKDQGQVYRCLLGRDHVTDPDIFVLLYVNADFRSAINPTTLLRLSMRNMFNQPVFEILMADERTDKTTLLPAVQFENDKQHLSCQRDLMMRLLDDPTIDPNFDGHSLLAQSLRNADIELRDKILNHPKSNIINRA